MPKLNTDKKHVSGPRLRVVIEPDVAIGPGKADLLEAIRDTGSISAAGRKLGMSYRRAWLLVDELNQHLGAPVVEAQTGGAKGGGCGDTPPNAGGDGAVAGQVGEPPQGHLRSTGVVDAQEQHVGGIRGGGVGRGHVGSLRG